MSHTSRLWSRYTGGKDGTLWYYRVLADAFRARGQFAVMVDELDRVVSEMKRLASTTDRKLG